MARSSSHIIPRVAFAPLSTPNRENQRRLAFSRVNNIVTGLGVSNEVQPDSNNNNNNHQESLRIFISVINRNDSRDRSTATPADPTVANTRRIERSVRNRSAASRSRGARGGARGESVRRAEREQRDEEEVEVGEDDDFASDFAPSRRSSRRRGKCDHNHALEKSFCSKCHIRRRQLCRWWCRKQYRQQV